LNLSEADKLITTHRINKIESGSIPAKVGALLEEAWNKALRDLKDELPASLYEPLLRSVKTVSRTTGDSENNHDRFVIDISDGQLLPQLPLHSERIQNSLRSHTGRDVILEFRDANLAKPASPPASWINPRYSFDRFIRGNSNQMALMACEAVATQPGRTSPLYLYGESGMGKTHLVQALAAELLRRDPGLRICYTLFEDLRDEFIQSLNNRKTLEFKESYRAYDVLIIEDIQYLRPTSETLQEEFFHIFNHYYEGGKQIVLSSERPVSELMVSSRLMSRLLSGLQVRINASDPAMREQVIEARAGDLGVRISDEVKQFLCSRVTTSIRELESALNKLFFLEQKGIAIDSLKSVQEHLTDLVPADQNLFVPLDTIVEVICRRYNITKDQILSSSRKAEFTLPRHIAMYLGIQYSNLNKSAIARYFRKSDHTTVINAERNIQKRIQKEMGFAPLLDDVVSEMRKKCV
jgi:chromosomal replication initiator protein